jgi:uncharacterized protein
VNKLLRVVIVHGSFGSPEENWFPWLSRKIDHLGYKVIVPRFPTPEGQNLTKWKEVFREQVGSLDEHTILIGHSVGVAFVLNLLEDKDAVPVTATFLVAGFLGELGLPEFDPIISTFCCKEFDWQRIKHNAGALTVLAGDNDPYVPLPKGQDIADALSVPLTIVPGGGHLNAEFGYTTFPLLERKLLPLFTAEPVPVHPELTIQ